MNPTVSVIITTKDRPIGILRRAYDSVIAQTMKPLEIILVNAGSESVVLSDVNRMIHIPGATAPVARNAGAAVARGDCRAFLDDDDEWLPCKLESQVAAMGDGVGMVRSPYMVEDKPFIVRHDSILDGNIIGSTSFPLISRQAFDAVGGFDESFQANQEWDLWIRISNLWRVCESELCAGIKHESSGSISSDTCKRISGWRSILKKHMVSYRNRPHSFCTATRTFMTEMYLRRSLRGYLIAFSWRIMAIRSRDCICARRIFDIRLP